MLPAFPVTDTTYVLISCRDMTSTSTSTPGSATGRLPGQPGLPAVANRDPAAGGGYDHRLARRRLLWLLQATARRVRVQAGNRHRVRRPLMDSGADCWGDLRERRGVEPPRDEVRLVVQAPQGRVLEDGGLAEPRRHRSGDHVIQHAPRAGGAGCCAFSSRGLRTQA